MPELPPFPTDPGTLTAIADTIHDPADGPTFDELLELLSGYTGAGEHADTVAGIPVVNIGPLYSREDVILALIAEVRSIDKRVQRAILSTAMSRHDAEWQWPRCHKSKCSQDHGDIEFVFSLMAKSIAENVRREMLCRAVTEPDE